MLLHAIKPKILVMEPSGGMSMQRAEVMIKGGDSRRDVVTQGIAKSGIRLSCTLDVIHKRHNVSWPLKNVCKKS